MDMHVAGAPSWRLAEAGSQMPHVALFVRDALQLPTIASPDNPPRLVSDVPDLRSTVANVAVRERAGAQWIAWWREVIDQEARTQQPGNAGTIRPWPHGYVDDTDIAYEEPELLALARYPDLRTVVEPTLTAAYASTHARAGGRGPQRSNFHWETISQVAEQVALDFDVSSDAVDGTVLVLEVGDIWWHRMGPGRTMCSIAACADQVTARVLLKDVFESQLTR
jgi:hypothetical protein